jgi:hypothetical protein
MSEGGEHGACPANRGQSSIKPPGAPCSKTWAKARAHLPCRALPQEFEVTTLPVPIHGVQLLSQVAACQVGERFYAVACVALAGPFLSNSLQSLLLHWAASCKPGARWEQPPSGWLTSPSISHAQGAPRAPPPACPPGRKLRLRCSTRMALTNACPCKTGLVRRKSQPPCALCSHAWGLGSS